MKRGAFLKKEVSGITFVKLLLRSKYKAQCNVLPSPAPTDFTACPEYDTNYTPKSEFWHLLPVHLGEIGKGGSVRTPEAPRNPMARHLESIWRKVILVLQNVFSVANRPCSTLTGVVTRQLAFSRGRFWLLQELTTWLQTTECRPAVSPRVQSSKIHFSELRVR